MCIACMSIKGKILYWCPRVLAILFVVFLSLFSFDGFTEFNGWQTILAVIIHLAVPVVVLLATVVAWKKDLVGTIIFFALAVYYVYMVGFNRPWSWYAAISGPALVTSALFLANWLYRAKKE